MPGLKRTRSDKPKFVVSFSRRTDGVGNPAQLASFLSGLKAGAITYAHPKFALNRNNTKTCTYPVSPETVAALSFWSKDFTNLIGAWADPETAALLNKYRHHFSFAINGPSESILEPGVVASIQDRVENQLAWLVNKCLELGQDPNASILVKVDPISVYRVAGEEYDRDTLGHLPYLCEYLKAYGLTRLHISFTQFSFNSTKSRLRKMSDHFVIRELSPEQERALIWAKILPFTGPAGIQVQTCSALQTVAYYRSIKSDAIISGACCGWRDIASITHGETKMAFNKAAGATESTRGCTCYPHRDTGDKSEKCTHGCRYCFSNPKLYDF